MAQCPPPLKDAPGFAVLTVTTRVRMLTFGIATIVLRLVYCPADDTLFEVGPEICCLGV